MSISKDDKILASDIRTISDNANKALPKAGTGIAVSTDEDGTTVSLSSIITAGNAGPSANATLGFGGTFTVPYFTYDEYGRITGKTNRTLTMPTAPTGNISGNAATATRLQTARKITMPKAYMYNKTSDAYLLFDGSSDTSFGCNGCTGCSTTCTGGCKTGCSGCSGCGSFCADCQSCGAAS